MEEYADPDTELDEVDEDEALETAQRQIEEEQVEFINGCLAVMELYKEKNPTHLESIEGVAEGIIGLIEGNSSDEGYVLVKRTDADFAVLPCSRQVYEEHLRDFPTGVGHDLSDGLLATFNDINN